VLDSSGKRLYLRRSGENSCSPAVVTAVRVSVPRVGSAGHRCHVRVSHHRAPRRWRRPRLSTSDSRRTASRFWSVTASASVASGSVLSSSILSSNRTSIGVHGVPRFGHQRQPCLHGSQLLLNSRGLCDTTNFWAFRAFIDRLACTAEEYGISVELRSEAWTSQECPQCGSTDRTTRHRDTLTCPCGFEGHADPLRARRS